MNILAALKDGTMESHRALESGLPLMRDDLSFDEYMAMLKGFYGLYVPLERNLTAVNGFLEALPDWQARMKAPALAADLADLGIEARSAVRLCEDVPAPTTTAEAFAVAYVMEGATLGGQIISRHLRAVLGVHEDWGGRFFLSYKDGVGEMWQRFRIALQAAAPPGEWEAMVSASQRTFQVFREWLAEAGQDEAAPPQSVSNCR